MEGQTVLDGLETAGQGPRRRRSSSTWVATRPTATRRCSTTALSRSWRPRASSPPPSPPGAGADKISQTNFEQALTSLGGKVDGVWAANDTNASGVIKVLQDNNLTGVAVSGQDANVAGLQNILLGWQTATVYKPVKDEATPRSTPRSRC